MKEYTRYIPIGIAVVIIVSLTIQYTPTNVEISERFRLALTDFCNRIGMDVNASWWNTGTGIRKLGHVMEYGLLGMSSAIAFFDSRTPVKSVVTAVFLCMVVSLLDQVIKIFVPIHHFDITDWPFDAVGSVLGIVFITVVGVVVSKS